MLYGYVYVETSGQHGTFSLLLFTRLLLLFFILFWFGGFFGSGGGILPTLCLHHMYALCLERPEKGVKFGGL